MINSVNVIGVNSVNVIGVQTHNIRGQGADLVISFMDAGFTTIGRSDSDKFVIVSGTSLMYGDRVYQCKSQETTLRLAKSIVEGGFNDVVAKGVSYSSMYELFMASMNV